jgi:hypothetical protein
MSESRQWRDAVAGLGDALRSGRGENMAALIKDEVEYDDGSARAPPPPFPDKDDGLQQQTDDLPAKMVTRVTVRNRQHRACQDVSVIEASEDEESEQMEEKREKRGEKEENEGKTIKTKSICHSVYKKVGDDVYECLACVYEKKSKAKRTRNAAGAQAICGRTRKYMASWSNCSRSTRNVA